ncbi:MAG: polyphosphate kinase 2 family protein [Candidatus Methylomirabilia bacterium]
MLEKVDLSLAVPKEAYKRRIAQLQERLYDLVHTAFQRQIPAMIVFEGWAAAGKGGTINVLTERLDPRGVRVVPISPPRSAELRFPWMWRYWQKIPAYGQTVIYDTSWYRRVLIDRVGKTVKKSAWKEAYQDIVEFEAMLGAEGTLIRKFWLQISKKEQNRRFRKLLASPLTSWQVAGEDAAQNKKHERYTDAVEEMLARTDYPHAPWIIVEATDRYHTRIKVFEEIVRAFEDRLAAHLPPPRANGGAAVAPEPGPKRAAGAARARRRAKPQFAKAKVTHRGL